MQSFRFSFLTPVRSRVADSQSRLRKLECKWNGRFCWVFSKNIKDAKGCSFFRDNRARKRFSSAVTSIIIARVHFTARNCHECPAREEFSRENCPSIPHTKDKHSRLSIVSMRFNLSWLITRIMQRVFWPAIASGIASVNMLFNLFAVSKTRNLTSLRTGPIVHGERRKAGRCLIGLPLPFSSRWFQWLEWVSSPSFWTKCSNHRAGVVYVIPGRNARASIYVTLVSSFAQRKWVQETSSRSGVLHYFAFSYDWWKT